jgi:hypothetical protein
MQTLSDRDADERGIDKDQTLSEHPILVIQLNTNGEIIFVIFDQVALSPSTISPPLELDIATKAQPPEEFNQERTTI